MGQANRYTPFVVLLILVVVLQGALIGLDCVQTPARVAKQFAKDYEYLDTDMQNYLCQELAQSDAVADYLYAKQQEAAQRGLSTNYLRRMFTEIEVEPVSQDATSAKLRIDGITRVAINPAFMVIGKLFFIGENYPVETTLDLVKEGDGWKVCGTPFGLKASEQ